VRVARTVQTAGIAEKARIVEIVRAVSVAVIELRIRIVARVAIIK
jgi:hypothetical protein